MEELSVSKIASWPAQQAGCNLLAFLLTDQENTVRCKALELFVRRSYRTFGVAKDSKVKVVSPAAGILGARWRFRHPGVSISGGSKGMLQWQGSAKVVPDVQALRAFLAHDLNIGIDTEEKARKRYLSTTPQGSVACTSSCSEKQLPLLQQLLRRCLPSVQKFIACFVLQRLS